MIYRHSGLIFTDHFLTVPLDHADPDGRRLRLFAREVAAADRADADLPYLLYLEGGPGHRSPRTVPAWLRRAVRDYRVVLMDQRGTGRSTPATRQTLTGLDDPAAYLRHFRADSIVSDAELLRTRLAGDRPWSVLGQSFGGFCAVSYLSFAPEGLREVMIAGGLPPLDATPDEVYLATYPRVLAHNDRYFERYPEDAESAKLISEMLGDLRVMLPTGGRLTPRRFQMLGMGLGLQSRFDALHHLLEEAFVDGPGNSELSDVFLRRVDSAVSFTEYPLYALLHEAIYCQGTASAWAAERVRRKFPEFDPDRYGPVCFTGEMVFPWLFAEDPALEPLAECAERLAAYPDWPRLYDPGRLAVNTVPVGAVVYHDDMYVDADMALSTAQAIRGLQLWITNEYAHDGITQSEAVLDRLMTMIAS
ncbi:alpha/beta fold hydrolase [Actinoallomurus acanthiterrae]